MTAADGFLWYSAVEIERRWEGRHIASAVGDICVAENRMLDCLSRVQGGTLQLRCQ